MSGWVTMHTAAPSFWPLALPAVTVASGSLAPMIARRRAERSSVVSARGCSSRVDQLSLLAARDRHRHDLLRERAVLLRGHGPLVGAQRELVLLLRGMEYSRRRFSAVSIIPPGTG